MSFFGFDTSIPGSNGDGLEEEEEELESKYITNKPTSKDFETFGEVLKNDSENEEEYDYNDIDAMMEAKFRKQELEGRGGGFEEEDDDENVVFGKKVVTGKGKISLGDDDEDLNDETFGDVENSKLDKDFDFSGNHSIGGSNKSGQSSQQPKSLKSLWDDPVLEEKVRNVQITQMSLKQQTMHGFPPEMHHQHQQAMMGGAGGIPQHQLHTGYNPNAKPMTVQELESAQRMMQQQQQQQQRGMMSPTPNYGRPPGPQPHHHMGPQQMGGYVMDGSRPSQMAPPIEMSIEELEAKLRTRAMQWARPEEIDIALKSQAAQRGMTQEELEGALRVQAMNRGIPQEEFESATRLHAIQFVISQKMRNAALNAVQQPQRLPTYPNNMNPQDLRGQPPQGNNSSMSFPPGQMGQQQFNNNQRGGQGNQNYNSNRNQRFGPNNNQQQRRQNNQFQNQVPDENRPRHERYNNLMSQHEKELIAKIQISQLVTDDPYMDDFYYQIYTTLNNPTSGGGGGTILPMTKNPGNDNEVGSGNKKQLNWQQSLLMKSNVKSVGNVSEKMQLQMQRLIDSRKHSKPKGTSLYLEGALGKISLNSVKNPKQSIQIVAHHHKEHTLPSFTRLSHKKILRSIESIYNSVLNLEQLFREFETLESDNVDKWRSDVDTNVQSIWAELGLDEPVAVNLPHPLAYFLSYSKGKKVLPRVINFLNPEQIMIIFTTLITRLESLDVCNMPTGMDHEPVEEFMTAIIPSLVGFVTDLPLRIVNSSMRIILERHNMVWLARSKVGLAILTMLLSRAEILKQGAASSGGAGASGAVTAGINSGLPVFSDQDHSTWMELYNFLFMSLHTHFASIFPPIGMLNASSSDEVYLWQFLAAVGVGATSVDHQKVLVSEVRERVLETARRNDNLKAIANVNLFLNALGLGIDAHQLAALSN